MSKQHSRCERYGKGWRLKKGEIPQTQRTIIWIRVLCINNNDVLFALCTTTTITRSKIIIHTMCEQNICEPIWLIAAHCSIYNEIFSSIRLRLYECDLRIRVWQANKIVSACESFLLLCVFMCIAVNFIEWKCIAIGRRLDCDWMVKGKRTFQRNALDVFDRLFSHALRCMFIISFVCLSFRLK